MQAATMLINRYALQHNLQRLRELVPNSKLIAIVKANAYGHGLLETARTLYDADAFGVARLEEALCLRDDGIKQSILLLEGFLDSKDLLTAVENKLDIIVHNEEQLQVLEKIQLSQPITVWMKLDTGIHRLGIRLEIADTFYQRLCQCNNIQQPVNIMSHLAHTDILRYNTTKQQLNIFKSFCAGKPGMRSIAASAGILFWSQSHFDWVRPGIILYGISPLMDRTYYALDFGFRPVMSLISNLIAVRKHKAGEPVGYKGKWVSKRDTYLGVVAIGYGDGYPHSLPVGTPVLINGREVPIVGCVTMDMICVDLGPKARDKIGDVVVLWGENLPVERISQITGINVYTLTTCLTSRVAVTFLN